MRSGSPVHLSPGAAADTITLIPITHTPYKHRRGGRIAIENVRNVVPEDRDAINMHYSGIVEQKQASRLSQSDLQKPNFVVRYANPAEAAPRRTKYNLLDRIRGGGARSS